jgi:hypothetical protein
MGAKPDLSEFDKVAHSLRKAKQRVGIVDLTLGQLAEDEPGKAEALRAALEDPATYPAPAVRRVMTGWGYEVSDSTIKSWRERNVIKD